MNDEANAGAPAHRRAAVSTSKAAYSDRDPMVKGGSSRLTREDWINFARRVLVQSGIDDVKIDRLARKAKVTRGSFYWHFKNRDDLLQALLKDWEIRNRVETASVRDIWSQNGPEFVDVIAVWLLEDRSFLDFDIAIRSWARRAPAVANVVARVDAEWIDLLKGMFDALGYSETESLVRARITYFHQIGYHVLSFREDFSDRIRLVPQYYFSLLGKPPPKRLHSLLDQLSKSRRIRKR